MKLHVRVTEYVIDENESVVFRVISALQNGTPMPTLSSIRAIAPQATEVEPGDLSETEMAEAAKEAADEDAPRFMLSSPGADVDKKSRRSIRSLMFELLEKCGKEGAHPTYVFDAIGLARPDMKPRRIYSSCQSVMSSNKGKLARMGDRWYWRM